MMNEFEAGEQAAALKKFQDSIGRPLFKWPYRKAREPLAHKRWRRMRSIVHRFRLYANASLPILAGMTPTFFNVEAAERAAYKNWLAYKHRREMHYLTGKAKTPPPWGC
jgi:hypothetical protein